jgi:phytoene dehydrogenase-like protein
LTDKSIIIIGAGLGGLAVGCYGQMNGYKTKIFEMGNKPGGVCVSWKRRDYNFDYAVHNVFGVVTNPENKKCLHSTMARIRCPQRHTSVPF